MTDSYEMETPTHLGTGAIGEPGQRVFYLQAADDNLSFAVKLEKQQVVALAQFLRGVLDDMPDPVGELPPAGLVSPIEPDWVVGQIAVGIDEAAAEIVLMIQELVLDDDSDEDDDSTFSDNPFDDVPNGSSFRVRIDAARAASFVAQVDELVAGGRPPCPLCGEPEDATHHCPRLN